VSKANKKKNAPHHQWFLSSLLLFAPFPAPVKQQLITFLKRKTEQSPTRRTCHKRIPPNVDNG